MPRYNPYKANHNRKISRYDKVWENRTSQVPLNLKPSDIKTAKDGRRYYVVNGQVKYFKQN